MAKIRKRVARHARHWGRCTKKATYPGWEGVALRSCEYEAGGLQATFIVANAKPQRIARWIVRSCLEIGAKDLPRCAERLRRHIQRQSSYQFPVAGVVIEDLYPHIPGMEIYAFRNGVTVKVKGFENGSNKQPSPEQIEAALHGPVIEVMRYARIQSTTREQYRAAGGKVDVGGSAAGKRKSSWAAVVGELYRQALGQDRNELMIAWAKANRKRLE